MVTLIMEKVPASLRGELSKWMLEIKAGVFVGQLSAMVREKIWNKTCAGAAGGPCLIVWSTNNEQGFDFDFWGAGTRFVTEWEGMRLITVQRKDVDKKRLPTDD